MKTSDFDYDLPPERIAQTPLEPRHASRLMVLDRSMDELRHSIFSRLSDFIQPGDVLVVNQTRVIPARLPAHKPTGGKAEILLLRQIDGLTWEALVGGKNIHAGSRLVVDDGPAAKILSPDSGTLRQVRFDEPIETFLPRVGQIPLPPYIHTPLHDPDRYQTIYANIPGSAAAPTAGLHFTPELIESLEKNGNHFARVTLHVGLDTFAPVTEEEVQDHHIHTEWCDIPASTVEMINTASRNGKRIIAVGTTSVRTLETAALYAAPGERVGVYQGPTSIFITPGYTFKAVDAMITNFHLPHSTLIMLVSAFAGRERVLSAYRKAVDMSYRFYSFGDAMLIL